MRTFLTPRILVLLFTASCQGPEGGLPADSELSQRLGTMAEASLARRIGQAIVVGFDGSSEADDGVRSAADLLRDGMIGGVIFYARNVVNPRQIIALTSYFKSAKPTAMLFVDQEGGAVQRLNEKNGFSRRYPKAIDMAALPEEVARRDYTDMANELRAHGITDNLAPVVDLNINRDSPAIGQAGRSYSDNPAIVVRYASIFIDAHNSADVRTYLKHYPGHGSATKDSHLGFTDITHTWRVEELLPYKSLISSGHAQAIMTAHVFHAGVDDKYPATLSKIWIQGKLRGELGFSGVVITDDLHMGAITKQWTPEQAALLAMQAGCDILLFSNKLGVSPMNDGVLRKFVADIEAQIQAGDTELERHVSASYERVRWLVDSNA
jgi:beta-N-acetylhexosaminidase